MPSKHRSSSPNATNQLTTDEIADSAITTDKINDGDVTKPKLSFTPEDQANKDQVNGYPGLDASGNLVGPIILRHDTDAAIDAITLPQGELAATDDTYELRLGDGATAGGKQIAAPGFGLESDGSGGIQMRSDFNVGYEGTFYQGYGTIYSGAGGGTGTFAQGHTIGSGYIRAVFGAFAQGYCLNADINANSLGTFAQGHAEGADINAQSDGSFAQGRIMNGGGAINANGQGCFAQGTTAYGGTITAGTNGAFAHGFASNCTINANGGAAFAMGYGYNSTIQAVGDGTFAHGKGGYGGNIYAGAHGARAHGITGAYYDITASGLSSFAHGYAVGGNITASGNGSMAFGYANTAAIIASGVNSVQFGPGTNDEDLSLQVGSGIAIFGGTPASAAAGDIWLDTDVFVQTGDGKAKVDAIYEDRFIFENFPLTTLSNNNDLFSDLVGTNYIWTRDDCDLVSADIMVQSLDSGATDAQFRIVKSTVIGTDVDDVNLTDAYTPTTPNTFESMTLTAGTPAIDTDDDLVIKITNVGSNQDTGTVTVLLRWKLT